MKTRGLALAAVTIAITLSAAWAQAPPRTAKIDSQPLELTNPDRYQVPSIFEPVRRVTLVAPAEGVVRSQDAKAGASVREGQEVAQLDKAEANARLKIAQAEVREQAALYEAAKSAAPADASRKEVAHARLEAAQARAEIAQLQMERCTLRAPFSGKLLASPISAGQYVDKGTVLAELADVSSVRVLIPLNRTAAVVGSPVSLQVDRQPITGKIQAVVPLTERMAVLNELSSPLSAAWVVVPNASGGLEPGQRVISPALPEAPIAIVPSHVVRKPGEKEKDGHSTVQVIRNEYAVDVKVRILGSPGGDRLQVTGPFRPTDALVVSSSVPLLAGTFVRFKPGTSDTIQATTPDPNESGITADLTPPAVGSRSAPIGAPGSAVPRGKSVSRPAVAAPAAAPDATKPAAKTGQSTVPF